MKKLYLWGTSVIMTEKAGKWTLKLERRSNNIVFLFLIFWLANFKNTIQLLYTKVPTYPGVLYIQVFVVRLADGYSEWMYER